jgi:hypothetical protein
VRSAALARLAALVADAARSLAECIVTFYDSALKAITSTASQEQKVTWNRIRSNLDQEYVLLTSMKFIDPTQTPAVRRAPTGAVVVVWCLMLFCCSRRRSRKSWIVVPSRS